VSGRPASIDAARAAKDRLGERLAGEALVNGVGLARSGEGWAVKVNLLRAAPDLDLPAEVDGVEVRVEVVGEIKAT
jgi:hypothetical protein